MNTPNTPSNAARKPITADMLTSTARMARKIKNAKRRLTRGAVRGTWLRVRGLR